MATLPASRLARLAERLCPELAALPADERVAAWRRASGTPFDVVELAGAAAGLVAVTWVTRYGVDSLGPLERFAYVIWNGAIALPLLAIVLAPVAIRRWRRGLRNAAARFPGSVP